MPHFRLALLGFPARLFCSAPSTVSYRHRQIRHRQIRHRQTQNLLACCTLLTGCLRAIGPRNRLMKCVDRPYFTPQGERSDDPTTDGSYRKCSIWILSNTSTLRSSGPRRIGLAHATPDPTAQLFGLYLVSPEVLVGVYGLLQWSIREFVR